MIDFATALFSLPDSFSPLLGVGASLLGVGATLFDEGTPSLGVTAPCLSVGTSSLSYSVYLLSGDNSMSLSDLLFRPLIGLG